MNTIPKQANLKILLCCHKDDYILKTEPYLPIHLGKSRSNIDLGIIGDNTGDNISDKNYCYCELTGMYWAWKNLKNVDFIGLCHYRRFFDFHKQCKTGFPLTAFPTHSIEQMDLSVPISLLPKLEKGYIVTSKPIIYGQPLFINYCVNLLCEGFHTLREVVNTTQSPIFKKAFYEVMYHHNRLSPYNMFIMKWEDFDNYCKWLFPLLSEVEKRLDISHYSPAQIRIYGYMGEFLLNIWIYAMNKKRIYKPVIWFNDNGDFWKSSLLRYKIRCLFNDIAVWFAKERSQIYGI